MKKVKKYIQQAVAAVILLTVMAGCELLGLELQTPYEYDYEAGQYNNQINMTAWEFIQSRPDLFSVLQEGIEYAGLQEMFSKPNCTYLLLTNRAFNSTTEADYSYFMTHTFPDPNDPLVMITPESLELYPVEQVKELLLYHIVKGEWTWSNLPASPTWYDTQATADTAKINMYLLKDRNPNIVFNNFEGHYKEVIKARTTNLRTNNKSYLHVLESWMDRPTKDQLKN